MASAPERKSQPLSISTGNILVSGSASSGNGLHSGSVGGDIANNGEIDAVHNDSLTTSINSNLMSTSQISTVSFGGVVTVARFPKLEECAHFHYERVQLGRIHIRIVDEKSSNDCNSSLLNDTASNRATGPDWFLMKVSAGRSDPFLIRRSYDNLQLLDSMLHRCVYDRRISELRDLSELRDEIKDAEQLEDAVSEYLAKFSLIASDTITCGSILTWLQLDNKGRRLPVADRDTMRTINTPAVGAAYGVRRYVAQACDEISIEVGDMISVIDMPSPAESIWWRGKKSHLQKNQYEVGFFPQNCVAIIGEKVPRNMPLPAPLVGQLALSPTKPVLRKHGKLISFFRSFILARPSRRRLKQSGIYKERVFSCDLSEHLLNSQQDIPLVLKHCAEFLENYGIVDGIYRLSGITSTIQKLRRAFDEERVPELTGPEFRHDIHAISSLLKMYFRELPNPLCTYQLYDEFVEAIQTNVDNNEQRLIMIKKVVQKLPPPHYRTLKYLCMHLYKISRYAESTGMTERNIAIVWAPNLLRSPAIESGGVAALKGVGVQAVVTEYLIGKCEDIFDDSYIPEPTHYTDSQPDSLSSLSSVIDARDLIQAERPKSLNVGAKLITLEEAQIKQNRVSLESNQKALPVNPTGLPTGCTSYIEVGGGPASLPDKYHTILPLPKNKRKPNSIMSLFYRKHPTSSTDLAAMTTSAPAATHIEPPEVLQFDLEKQEEEKEAHDTFDAKSPMIECKRSNSMDSLRTNGHSRSVSHDSYFDLLQSPLRGIVTLCPSREMSELGMNFDREEPEMRIFSESESLVSSPKPHKEPRRTTKIRIDETANVNVNPSPKKQPRLNIPQLLGAKSPTTPEEKLDKKYKFEDQLSDLQFIDSNTPEHTAHQPIFTSVQVHDAPMDTASKQTDPKPTTITNISTTIFSGVDPKPDQIESDFATLRYSYPSYDNRRKDERFSLPSPSTKMTIDDVVEEPITTPRSTTKLSITTPQSPMHSPSYSLLITSTTSSDNSSRADKPEPTAKRKDLTLNLRSAQQLPSDNNLSQISEPTSLSLTPSEIGYQQMQKPTNMSTDTTPKSETGGGAGHFYEYIKPGGTDNVLNMSPIKSSPTTPVRATINITYNLKSPTHEQTHDYEEVLIEKLEQENTDTDEKKGLLETSFDENVVYEQVKFLKSVVNDVNEIIYDDVATPMDTTEKQDHIDDDGAPERPPTPQNYPSRSQTSSIQDQEVPKTDSDVPMSDPDVVDSLEYDPHVSLYENVQQPKPKAVYENMKYDNSRTAGGNATNNADKTAYADNEVEYKFEVPTKIELKPPASTTRNSVRQLANKFETSPIDVAPPFDFSSNKVTPTAATRSPNKKAIKDMNTTITRSLDENAFVREFGSTRKLSTAKDTGVGQEVKGVLIESNCRRKSSDSLKPKTLNQPKKLPGLKQESEYCKMDSLRSVKKEAPPIPPPKITPTSENRICLVQQNVTNNNINFDNSVPSDDEKSTSSISSLRMLGSCKLDRERIEKIKEERRQALNEKFRSESFKTPAESKMKSKSRPDVRELIDKESVKPLSESLRIKSKSRAELSASKLSIDSSTDGTTPGLNRTRHNSESRKAAVTFTTAAADTKDSNHHFHSLQHKQKQQQQPHIEPDCDSNKVELRRSNNKMVDVGRRSVDYTRGSKDKFKALDPSATTDRMSIKDVAAMFESKSQNY